MSGRLPDFLVIGAQKSGTTSLQWALDSHPAVACIPEAHFFCCDYARRDLDWYRDLFAELSPGALAGEKCPCYLSHDEAIARIAETVPNAKLIAVLRDPVARTYAHYWHMRRRGKEDLGFAEALAAEPSRIAAGRPAYSYVEHSRYLPQLERVCNHFRRERLCVLIFEELTADPARALAPVWRFLGVEPPPAPPELPKANPYREYRPKWLWDFMHAHRLWRFLPKRAALALGNAMTREARYPPLDPGIERELRARLAPDTVRLAAWLGRDLGVWGSPANLALSG